GGRSVASPGGHGAGDARHPGAGARVGHDPVAVGIALAVASVPRERHTPSLGIEAPAQHQPVAVLAHVADPDPKLAHRLVGYDGDVVDDPAHRMPAIE